MYSEFISCIIKKKHNILCKQFSKTLKHFNNIFLNNNVTLTQKHTVDLLNGGKI